MAGAEQGEADTKACQPHQSFEKGGPAKLGPPLSGAVHRPKGSAAGFDDLYVLKAKGGTWSGEDLDAFLANPNAYALARRWLMPASKTLLKGQHHPLSA